LLVGSCAETKDKYDSLTFLPYRGAGVFTQNFITTKAYLMWGDKARMQFSGFMIEMDNENLWYWS